jgi:hypothetical protein
MNSIGSKLDCKKTSYYSLIDISPSLKQRFQDSVEYIFGNLEKIDNRDLVVNYNSFIEEMIKKADDNLNLMD